MRRSGRELLERDAELAAIEGAVSEAAQGDGRMVVLVGEAGIGKTRLIEATRSLGAVTSFRVLAARGGELEEAFSYGVVRQLLDGLVHDRTSRDDELFAGAARLAQPVFDLADTSRSLGADATIDPVQSLPYGLYWLIVALCEARPLLILVDDLHWADGASIRFLAYLARRLEGLPLAVVTAARPEQLDQVLSDLRAAGPAVQFLRPPLLTAEAVGTLVRARLDPAPAPAFVAACHASTAGNPFLVGELLEELGAEGVCATEDEVGAVRDLGPRTVANAVLVRLARLPEGTTEMARSLAVLGEATAMRHLADLAALDTATATAAIAALARSGIVIDGRPPRFVHPIVRRAIYEELTPSERALRHRRAAELLLADGAPTDAVAVHLLLVDGLADPGTVVVLRSAAQTALARGDPETAARYLRRAIEEPPPAGERPGLLLELGIAAARSSAPGAVALLRQACEAAPDPQAGAIASRLLAAQLFLSAEPAEAVQVLVSALDRLDGDNRELTLLVESDLYDAVGFDPSAAARLGDRLDRLREVAALGAPTSHGERLALVSQAVHELRIGRSHRRCAEMAQRALAGGHLLAVETADSPRFVNAVTSLMFCDELVAADEALREAVTDARARGSAVGFAHAMIVRSFVATRRGLLADADADARSVLDLAEPVPSQLAPALVAALVDAATGAGSLDKANALLRDHGMDGDVPDAYTSAFLLGARARLRLGQGRHQAAVDDFLECGRRQERIGMINPAVVAWHSGAAVGLAARGDPAAGRELAEEGLARARAFGAPRTVGIALRGLAATWRGEGRIELLREAVATLAASPAWLDEAGALIDLGMALRRARRRGEAREPLRHGLDRASRCGAEGLARLAEGELRAAGAKPRRAQLFGLSSLTPSEQRVATMAGAGLTNRQIAQQLFVSLRTVENHLSGVYRKLDIDSRGELSAALADT